MCSAGGSDHSMPYATIAALSEHLDTPTKTTCAMAANILRDMAILAWKAAKRRQ